MAAAAQSKLHTTVGRRFSRFAVAAVAAVVASQTTLAVLLGAVGWTAGRSALAAWVAGAGTSYLVSRWAWERKGRPHLLKETVPFWIVAVCAAVVLTTTTKIANQRGIAMGLSHTQQLIFVGAAYFVANCVTFLTRFVIFHYVLFKDREAKLEAPAAAADPVAGPGSPPGPVETFRPGETFGAGPLAVPGLGDRAGNGSAPVNGSAQAAGTAGRSRRGHRPATDPEAVTEPGTRR
jgi:putative flippase GtrA